MLIVIILVFSLVMYWGLDKIAQIYLLRRYPGLCVIPTKEELEQIARHQRAKAPRPPC